MRSRVSVAKPSNLFFIERLVMIMFLLHNSRAFPLLLITIFSLISFINSQQPIAYNYHWPSDPTNDTASANYISNLNALLNSLSSKASSNTFYTDTSNGIYGLFLCRGDVSNNICQNCVNNASQRIRQACPSEKQAIIWYDQCMLRYSNVSFFGEERISPRFLMWNNENTTASGDDKSLGALSLIYSLIGTAPSKEMMYWTDDSEAPDGSQQHRYGLVQCTRDISRDDCRSCLSDLTHDIEKCCGRKKGWRISGPNCNMRYEDYLFYEQPAALFPFVSTVPPPVPDHGGNVTAGKGGNNTTMIVIITVSSVTVVAALSGFWYYSSSSRKRRQLEEGRSQEILLRNIKRSNHTHLREGDMHGADQDNSGGIHCFDLATIQAATNNFSNANKLGYGGFGPVYKGKLLDGKEIAVKRLSMKSRQGLDEFMNEVLVTAKLQHKNLVRLLGYCLKGDEKLLVYEYMVNTSLDAFLFDPEKCMELDWTKRENIIIGTARGLLYLHEDSRLKIIHRDMKTSNVLLDNEMNPKISDFGTARIFEGKQIEANTERVVGTFGYMAPEYAMEGLFSIKSDVYSFGILMLEIITGKKNKGIYHPECGQSLLTYAWWLWNEDKGLELIDPNIVDSCPTSEVLQWIHIALLCVQDDPADRPTMSSVVLMLGSKTVNLPHPLPPPHSVGRFITMSDQSSISGTRTGFLTLDKTSTSASS